MNVDTFENIPTEYTVYKIAILKKSLLITFITCFIAFFFSRNFFLGFFIGGLLSMANFSLLAKHIIKMRNFSVNKAKRYIVGKFLIIYFIMGLALFIGATKGMLVFAATALGLIVIKIAIFLDRTVIKHAKPS